MAVVSYIITHSVTKEDLYSVGGKTVEEGNEQERAFWVGAKVRELETGLLSKGE